jgi:hypothetical protein
MLNAHCALAIFCFLGGTLSVHAALKLTADLALAVLCHQIVCDDVLLFPSCILTT